MKPIISVIDKECVGAKDECEENIQVRILSVSKHLELRMLRHASDDGRAKEPEGEERFDPIVHFFL